MEESKNKEVVNPMENLEFVEKPIRKPDSRTYGRLEEWDDSGFKQFVPTAVGSGKKKTVVKASGRAKLVKNEGEKDSSYSLYCNRNADDENFADHMVEDIMNILKSYVKKEIKLPNAKFIHDEDSFKVWRSVDRCKFCVHAEIDGSLEKVLLSKEWARISYEINKIIYTLKSTKK